MIFSNVCPQCGTNLPPRYPYDHVAIDRALADENGTSADRLTADERDEAIREGHRRGLGFTGIMQRLRCSAETVNKILGDTPAVNHDQQIKVLYHRGLTDQLIAIELGIDRRTVQKTRARLQLPALYGPGGRQKWKEGAAA